MLSDTSSKVGVTEDMTVARDSFVKHVEHGPMIVDQVMDTPDGKKVELKNPVSNLSITLSENKLREQWGEQVKGVRRMVDWSRLDTTVLAKDARG
jgi:hypothetical protein